MEIIGDLIIYLGIALGETFLEAFVFSKIANKLKKTFLSILFFKNTDSYFVFALKIVVNSILILAPIFATFLILDLFS